MPVFRIDKYFVHGNTTMTKRSNENQIRSKLIEHLNKTLSIENAVIERINARKDETPIQEVKQRLIHLNETHKQKIDQYK
jgi:hypothetical protein